MQRVIGDCVCDNGLLCMQIVKVAVTVYYGSRYQCEKVPQQFAVRAAQSNKVHLGLADHGKIAALKPQTLPQ